MALPAHARKAINELARKNREIQLKKKYGRDPQKKIKQEINKKIREYKEKPTNTLKVEIRNLGGRAFDMDLYYHSFKAFDSIGDKKSLVELPVELMTRNLDWPRPVIKGTMDSGEATVKDLEQAIKWFKKTGISLKDKKNVAKRVLDEYLEEGHAKAAIRIAKEADITIPKEKVKSYLHHYLSKGDSRMIMGAPLVEKLPKEERKEFHIAFAERALEKASVGRAGHLEYLKFAEHNFKKARAKEKLGKVGEAYLKHSHLTHGTRALIEAGKDLNEPPIRQKIHKAFKSKKGSFNDLAEFYLMTNNKKELEKIVKKNQNKKQWPNKTREYHEKAKKMEHKPLWKKPRLI